MSKDRMFLLLTGTIDSNVYNNIGNIITDIDLRRSQYENAIYRYITETPFTDIVFIENSGFGFDVEKYKNLAAKHGKRFEFVNGSICREEILKYGKSFGDAYLISEALHKSELLQECETFYKITGRIFLLNSKRVCRTYKKSRNEFIIYNRIGWCLTNIFKANKTDYLKVLDTVYLDCNEATANDIEIAFYKRLVSSDIELGSFRAYPYFEGKMGATGRNYSGNVAERAVRNVFAFLNGFKYGSPASKLFDLITGIMRRQSYKKEK